MVYPGAISKYDGENLCNVVYKRETIESNVLTFHGEDTNCLCIRARTRIAILNHSRPATGLGQGNAEIVER
jgi:hypothetical protein